MSLQEQISADLKTAMISRDSLKVDVLKGLKSAFLYASIELGVRDEGLNQEQTLSVIKKESKKRKDSIELYKKAGNKELAEKEQQELAIIEAYLPEQLSREQLDSLVSEVLSELSIDSIDKKNIGKVIGLVKQKAGPLADGSEIAKSVQARVS
jgi:uncharacterized protein YqeY